MVVGGTYLDDWNRICRRSWSVYCKRNGIDIVLIKEPISGNEEKQRRTIHWDKLLLKRVRALEGYDLVAWVDADIVMNGRRAPDIFEAFDHDKIGAVSLMYGFPFDLKEAKRRVARLRHRYVDSNYPLDSIITQDDNLTYRLINKPVLDDFINTGVLVYHLGRYGSFFEDVFDRYRNETVFDGYEQCHLSYEIVASGFYQRLPYGFNAIWNYEMAMNYPFLYFPKQNNEALMKACRYTTLLNSYFLHFPGWRYEKTHFFMTLSEEEEDDLFNKLEV